MYHYLLLPSVAFLTTLAGVPLARMLGRRVGAWDNPNGLGMHATPVARSGGVAILLGITVALELQKALPCPLCDARQGAAISIGMLAFFFVGILDDLHEIKPYVKTIGLVGASLLFTLLSPQFTLTGYERADFILANLALISSANAMNFIDGMDGLAAGMGVIAATGFFILAQIGGLCLPGKWALIAAAAVLAFWLVNKPPATIFMGDGGSLMLGASLAGMLLITGSRGRPYLLAGLIILSPLIIDTGLAIARRAVLRRDIFSGDRRHIYDLLYLRNRSVWRTDLLMYALGLLFVLAAIVSLFVPLWVTLTAVAGCYAALVWRFIAFGMFTAEK